jgi:homoserine O-succinyltransferase
MLRTICLSIGIEHIDAIIADLNQALAAAVGEIYLPNPPQGQTHSRGSTMNWLGEPNLAADRRSSDRPIVIGLVNNASNRALKATETQFLRLLLAAAPSVPLCVKRFTFPEFPRASPPRGCMDDAYADLAALYEGNVDALIVTGMEPQTSRLDHEPMWESFQKLVDWAEDRSLPVMWSCLAAHAAVFHLDGVERVHASTKVSGVFDCEVVATEHPLMAGMSPRWAIPHSRQFGVPEESLAVSGYRVLSRCPKIGVDAFVKDSLPFLFLQGHPEYDADALLREYTRDARRYLIGERDLYPAAPSHYFGAEIELELTGIRKRALDGQRDLALLQEIMTLVKSAPHSASWQVSATRLYENWLNTVVPRYHARHLKQLLDDVAGENSLCSTPKLQPR